MLHMLLKQQPRETHLGSIVGDGCRCESCVALSIKQFPKLVNDVLPGSESLPQNNRLLDRTPLAVLVSSEWRAVKPCQGNKFLCDAIAYEPGKFGVQLRRKCVRHYVTAERHFPTDPVPLYRIIKTIEGIQLHEYFMDEEDQYGDDGSVDKNPTKPAFRALRTLHTPGTLVAQLFKHPNIMPVLEVTTGSLYGMHIVTLLREPATAAPRESGPRALTHILRAVSYIHAMGLYHNDIRTTNLKWDRKTDNFILEGFHADVLPLLCDEVRPPEAGTDNPYRYKAGFSEIAPILHHRYPFVYDSWTVGEVMLDWYGLLPRQPEYGKEPPQWGLGMVKHEDFSNDIWITDTETVTKMLESIEDLSIRDVLSRVFLPPPTRSTVTELLKLVDNSEQILPTFPMSTVPITRQLVKRSREADNHVWMGQRALYNGVWYKVPRLIGARRLELLEKIGEGAYGSVWTTKNRPDIVVKRVMVDSKELQALDKLVGSPNVLSPLSVVQGAGDPFICYWIMNKLSSRSLDDQYWDEETRIVSFIRGALKGLKFFEEVKLYHNDLAAGNILINAKGEGVLADFSLVADKPQSGTTTQCWFKNPEVVAKYPFVWDNWGLGLVLAGIIRRGRPGLGLGYFDKGDEDDKKRDGLAEMVTDPLLKAVIVYSLNPPERRLRPSVILKKHKIAVGFTLPTKPYSSQPFTVFASLPPVEDSRFQASYDA
ncbi:protein ORF87 [Anguillid herpesvirus 1]|uniref:Protein ORF87 n=1 Tax=Anguillid herpesvirus 1 TaxID=150286 RepID=A0A8E5ANE6_9VIRU|nr:protein ORF87 [Anguillid herpesvirus 1]ADA57850.1 protein ORF87 [Anguillid herpesvirus 1]QRM16380.1 protein ORF87 [Anguillid herpesvirus 1]QRM16508.1 protein ORF87 [Anguillid herpesvirus 1]QRM16639.1 protein ORF87 [Anguillid herpesvirus 1]QRM16772.1 protein ORF87 [Anguillid herpesvirus 1]